MNLKVGGYKPESDEIDLTVGSNEPTATIEETQEQEIVVNTETPTQEVKVPEQQIQDNQPAPPEQTVVTNEISDDLFFSHLSEKLGKEIKSLDELIPQQQSNPLDEDPYLKQLADWRKQTGRPIEDWIKYQKDYESMNDVEVVREYLQHKYPSFTNEDIDLKLSDLYPDEDLDDEREIAKKKLALKELAFEGRGTLNSLKSDLGTPNYNLPPELKEDLELAKQVKEHQAKITVEQQSYLENIKRVSNVTDKFKIQLSDDIALDYSISEQSRKEIPSLVGDMPHWRNQDGSWNHEAVVKDVVKIKHFDDMVRMAYEQGLNSGKEELIKQTKNTNFQENSPSASNNISSSNIIVEDMDELVGNNGLRIRKFFNK